MRCVGVQVPFRFSDPTRPDLSGWRTHPLPARGTTAHCAARVPRLGSIGVRMQSDPSGELSVPSKQHTAGVGLPLVHRDLGRNRGTFHAPCFGQSDLALLAPPEHSLLPRLRAAIEDRRLRRVSGASLHARNPRSAASPWRVRSNFRRRGDWAHPRKPIELFERCFAAKPAPSRRRIEDSLLPIDQRRDPRQIRDYASYGAR